MQDPPHTAGWACTLLIASFCLAAQGAAIDDFAVRSSYPSLDLHRGRGGGHDLGVGSSRSSNKTSPPPTMSISESCESSMRAHIVLVHDPSVLCHSQTLAEGEQERGTTGVTGGGGKEGAVPALRLLRHPVVLVVSDITGRDDMPFTVDGLLPKHLRGRSVPEGGRWDALVTLIF